MIQPVGREKKTDFYPYVGILANSVRWISRSSVVMLNFKETAKWSGARLSAERTVVSLTEGKREAGKKEEVGVSRRQTEKKGCLLADAGVRGLSVVIACHSPCETEAIYPMKYSPNLFLLKKEWRGEGVAGRWGKCATIDRWRVPQMLLMSSLLRLFYMGCDGDTSRGSIKCSHKCTLNSTSVSTAWAPSPRHTLLILL